MAIPEGPQADRSGAGSLYRAQILLVVMACAIYSISQFLRNSVGVIAPDLTVDLDLSPDQLGILSSSFFFSFALAQIPVGLALDRFGPRLAMASLVGLAVVGCVLFANGHGMLNLTVARILMGLGCSVMLMGPLFLFSRWFADKQFSTLVGLLLAIGTIGTLVATAPLAWASQQFGWRGAFIAVGIASAIIGVLVAFTIRDAPPGDAFHERAPESLRQSLRGLREIIAIKDFWPLFAMHFVSYAAFVTLLGLWGGPYLADIYGLDLTARGNYLFVLALGQVIGLIVWGPIDRLMNSRKTPALIGCCLTAAILGILAFWPQISQRAVLILFAIYGFAAGFSPLVIAHGRHLFPQYLVGRGITFLNMSTMGGVFLIQLATGYIIAWFDPIVDAGGIKHNVLQAYQYCFGFIVVCMVVAILCYLKAGDRKPADDINRSRP